MSRRGPKGPWDRFAGRLAKTLAHLYAEAWQRRREGGLGPGAMLVLAVNALFILGINLSNAFVNVYLWKIQDSLGAVAWYHVYQYLGLVAGFLVAGKFAESMDRTTTLRAGVLLHAAFFFFVLTLREDSARYIPRLGALLGVGAGFYWLGVHVLSFDLTEDDNVDRYHGLFYLLGGVGVTVAPFVAGSVIARSASLAGYRLVFTGSLTLFLLCILVSLLLYTRESDGAFTLAPAVFPRSNPDWLNLMGVHFLNGVRNGVFIFLIGILVFERAGSEFGLGLYYLATGGLTLISSYLVGRLIDPSKRLTAIFWGLSATTFSVVFLALSPNLLGLAVYGLVDALSLPVYGIPFGALNFSVMGRDSLVADLRVEYIVARELPLNLGRLAGLSLFLLLAPWVQTSTAVLRIVLIVYGCAPAFGWLLLRRIEA